MIEREIAGAINMYNHFVEQNSNPQEPFIHILYVEKNNNELVTLDKENFSAILKSMTAEYPELNAKIGTKGYGFKHIAQIVSTYNAWMMNNGEEVVLGMN